MNSDSVLKLIKKWERLTREADNLTASALDGNGFNAQWATSLEWLGVRDALIMQLGEAVYQEQA